MDKVKHPSDRNSSNSRNSKVAFLIWMMTFHSIDYDMNWPTKT